MSDLVSGLLTYSRVGGDSAPCEPVPCLRALEMALANLRTSIAESHARICTKIE